MDRRLLPASDQEMWYRARGIVEFRTHHRARAREIDEGVAQFPTSGRLLSARNQVLYNLRRRGIEYDLLPWCRPHRLPIMAAFAPPTEPVPLEVI